MAPSTLICVGCGNDLNSQRLRIYNRNSTKAKIYSTNVTIGEYLDSKSIQYDNVTRVCNKCVHKFSKEILIKSKIQVAIDLAEKHQLRKVPTSTITSNTKTSKKRNKLNKAEREIRNIRGGLMKLIKYVKSHPHIEDLTDILQNVLQRLETYWIHVATDLPSHMTDHRCYTKKSESVHHKNSDSHHHDNDNTCSLDLSVSDGESVMETSVILEIKKTPVDDCNDQSYSSDLLPTYTFLEENPLESIKEEPVESREHEGVASVDEDLAGNNINMPENENDQVLNDGVMHICLCCKIFIPHGFETYTHHDRMRGSMLTVGDRLSARLIKYDKNSHICSNCFDSLQESKDVDNFCACCKLFVRNGLAKRAINACLPNSKITVGECLTEQAIEYNQSSRVCISCFYNMWRDAKIVPDISKLSNICISCVSCIPTGSNIYTTHDCITNSRITVGDCLFARSIKYFDNSLVCSPCIDTFTQELHQNIDTASITDTRTQFPLLDQSINIDEPAYVNIPSLISASTKTHFCPLCDEQFGIEEDLSEHLADIARHQHLLVCSICPKQYSNMLSFSDHALTHITARKCSRTFHIIHHFLTHVHEQRKSNFLCTICKLKCSYKSDDICGKILSTRYNQYIRTESRQSECSVCGYHLPDNSQMQRDIHMGVHGGRSAFRCHVCLLLFTTIELLNRHTASHIACACGQTFIVINQYNEHRKTCNMTTCQSCGIRPAAKGCIRPKICSKCCKGFGNYKRHKCVKCTKVFLYPYLLRQHMANKHAALPCSKCAKVCLSQNLYDIHVKRHSIIKPKKRLLKPRKKFPCSICDKIFHTPIVLRYHMEEHTGSTHACKLCGKIFTNFISCRTHERSHNKRHKCTYCNKCYYSKYSLNYHIATHTGVRNFTCEKCGATFLKKERLESHLIRHDDPLKKRIFCDTCGAGFTEKCGLYRHKSRVKCSPPPIEIKITSGVENSYTCSKCNRIYKRRSSFMQHLKTHNKL